MAIKPETRAELIKNLEDILFDVQYAELGSRTQVRKSTATELVDIMITVLRISKGLKV